MKKFLMKRFALSEKGVKDFLIATLFVVLTNLSFIIPISILYYLVSDLIAGGISPARYWLYGAGTVLSVVIIIILNYFQYNAEYFTTYKESARRRISLAETLRKLPLSYFGKRDVADLTKIVLNDATILEHDFSHIMPQFFGAVISSVLIVVSLLFYDWRMAIASFWVFPVTMLIVFTSRGVQKRFSRPKLQASIECETGVQEYIDTIKDIKANSAERRMLVPIKKSIAKVEKKSIVAELGVAIFVISAQMILKVGIATTALVGSYLLINGQIGMMTFFMFLLVVSRVYEPMNGSLINLAAIINQRLTVDRMNEIYDYPVQAGDTDGKTEGYDLCFDDVKFSYNDEESVLRGVSFTAKQGEVTALVGPSGGGKSTVGKLAARFYDAKEGSITLGGREISGMDPETLLKNYSIVFQDVVLFNNTVMENIRIGNSAATDEQVMRAAKEANCDEFVNRLPDGYNTFIGENGRTLSGGERQRISIARALLKDAPVVLLDEATASLDAENETVVQEAISRLTKDKTVIIIAHRMRTVENADKVVFIRDGKVTEQGSPKDLIQKERGEFAQMVRLQKESAAWSMGK